MNNSTIKPTANQVYNKLMALPVDAKAKKFVEAIKASKKFELFDDILRLGVAAHTYTLSQKPAASEFQPSIYNPFKVMDEMAEQDGLAVYPKYIQSLIFALSPELRPFAMAWASY